MGTFNTLTIDFKCEHCGQLFAHRIQFKFAKTWQYEYKVNDKLARGNPRYDIGAPGLDRVRAYGILENELCPHCNELNSEYCDVIIEKDVIKTIAPIADLKRYDEDPNYNYYIDE